MNKRSFIGGIIVILAFLLILAGVSYMKTKVKFGNHGILKCQSECGVRNLVYYQYLPYDHYIPDEGVCYCLEKGQIMKIYEE